MNNSLSAFHHVAYISERYRQSAHHHLHRDVNFIARLNLLHGKFAHNRLIEFTEGELILTFGEGRKIAFALSIERSSSENSKEFTRSYGEERKIFNDSLI